MVWVFLGTNETMRTGILSFTILHAVSTMSDLFDALDYFKEMIAPQEVDSSTSSWSTEAFWRSVASNAASHAHLFQQSWNPIGVPVCCYSSLEADATSNLSTLLWVDSLIDRICWTCLCGRERDNESSFPICHIHIQLHSFHVFDGRCLGDEFGAWVVTT